MSKILNKNLSLKNFYRLKKMTIVENKNLFKQNFKKTNPFLWKKKQLSSKNCHFT